MKPANYISKIIPGFLMVSALLASCRRLIEIPSNPPTAITEAQQFADSATAMTAVAGIYSYQSNGSTGSFTFNDGFLSSLTGLSSDELLITSSQGPTAAEIYNNNITVNNGFVAMMWADAYQGLYPVNAAIANIAVSPGLSASFKKQITAEMKVVRALYYFYLINIFDAVPLVTGTDYKVTTKQPRTSADSIYRFIINELTEARQNISVNYPSPGRVRPNVNVVNAFLAKVYLYRKEWQKAYDAANAVIGFSDYSLETDLNKVFLDGSSEAIWQLPATGQSSATREAQQYIPYASGVVPDYSFTPALISAFETGDQRLGQWALKTVVNTGSGNQDFYYPYKYKVTYPPSFTVIEDFMIFRLSETYLIRAEAALKLGDPGSAVDDIDVVRTRAGLTGTTAATTDQIMTAIMHERQAELFCEWGNRWMDLKRTNTINAVLGSEKPGWDPHDALYPVPNKERNLNGQLSQNPGY